MKKVRCAIYTRKSSEEGLEQDFNSLHAQREACMAYILSQASEGWSPLPEEYDDGGLSGGTLERPALQRLLTDIEAGKIDIVVVYKVDRLTRSLLDFAKLVETMDSAEVSFVSVTQSFNTTNSMGRLTLNMLLSFAQFEREVTAERIRDKIAASKAKGMWMGGTPPLGYEPEGRSLAIVEEHAELVRDIYRRYRERGNVRRVAKALLQEGIRTPLRQTSTGKTFGNCRFTRGQLYAILKNPIYAGNIPHKGKVYPGNHKAIIARQEWEAVQQQLTDNTRGTKRTRQESRGLLAGLLFDENGRRLQLVHATKGTRRYGYYVSQPDGLESAEGAPPALRIPAREIEQVVRREVRKLLSDPLRLAQLLELDISPTILGRIEAMGVEEAATLSQGTFALLRKVLVRLLVQPDRFIMTLSRSGVAERFGMATDIEGPETIDYEVAVSVRRSGLAVRLVYESGARASQIEPDRALVRLIHKAQQWWAELAKGEIDIAGLSRSEGVSASWMTRVVRLAFLSPEVVEAIMAGRVRDGLDGKKLLASDAISWDWKRQADEFLPRQQSGSCANSFSRSVIHKRSHHHPGRGACHSPVRLV